MSPPLEGIMTAIKPPLCGEASWGPSRRSMRGSCAAVASPEASSTVVCGRSSGRRVTCV
uniref:Uncharacterized protein n=1 Tax=Triticum urartu TaxID=4572 RepID=A0A8R7TZJ1_TRIUA